MLRGVELILEDTGDGADSGPASEPVTHDEEMKQRVARLTAIKQQKDNAGAIAGIVYSSILFGRNHPYGHPAVGDDDSLNAVKAADVRHFYESFYRPNNSTLIVVGDVKPATIMPRGFAGTVAVPAWARFMKTATRDAARDWYEMPPDVEKVAICRISGARASDACRDHYIFRNNVPVATMGILPAGYPPPVPPLAEPAVYEDLFPVGTIPSELCPIHRAPGTDQNGERRIGAPGGQSQR